MKPISGVSWFSRGFSPCNPSQEYMLHKGNCTWVFPLSTSHDIL